MQKLILKNKFSKSDYEIHSKFECGISLLGWEVKSLRAQNAKIENSFCYISKKMELWLNNLYIAQYMNVKGDSERSRKLLVHKSEILKIKNSLERLNLILIPTSMYWDNNKIKVEIALAKKLKKFDKRQKEKELEAKKKLKQFI
ncbi:SsrA-binding protein [Metamycoplasma subdolum]|uniref:SsrA-binding protein n=1 Tax=Metamycoplasma subdolum TaxID=92407 RepID=A0A3M0A0W8_9BACT|nr:SsrA-binding protein SmpB [Metamycoplasma subdolum]RMA78653.1 SsrA-binding protein [Metamycoplasma subdolum]WPB50745.1 SsrA-binding protein SmpB [Metamycoplasma subdolum]